MAYYIKDIKDENFDYDNYKTYKIEIGDTLLSVAEKLEISPAKLKHYHNHHCGDLNDLIEDDFKSHLQYVILAPDKVPNQELPVTQRKKVLFDPDSYSIPFRPINIDTNYAVQFTIESREKKTKIGYEASVKWIGIDSDGVCFFEIDRISNFFIDENKAYTTMDKLSEKTAKVIYPLTIAVNQIGKWIDIMNFEGIQKRWKKTKTEVIEDNRGKITSTYLEETEYTLSDKSRFMKRMANDWFLRSLFNGVHNDYGAEFGFNQDIKFPVIPNKKSINYDVKHKIDEYLDNKNLILIEQNGSVSEQQTDLDLANNYLTSGKYSAKYHLDPNHYSVQKVELECSIGDEEEEEKTMVKIYNLNQNKEYALGTRQPIYLGEEKIKEGFFTGFINAFKI